MGVLHGEFGAAAEDAPAALDAAVRAWALTNVLSAASSGAFNPAAMTRAGEYLARGDMFGAASAAARDATARARGLLPAYFLGLRCAAVSVVTNGLPVPPAKITTRPFSRCRIARRRMKFSHTRSTATALSTRVSTPIPSSVSWIASALITVPSMPM